MSETVVLSNLDNYSVALPIFLSLGNRGQAFKHTLRSLSCFDSTLQTTASLRFNPANFSHLNTDQDGLSAEHRWLFGLWL